MTAIKLCTILVALACFAVAALLLKGTGYDVIVFGAGVGLLGWIAPEGGKKKAAKASIVGIVLLLGVGCTASQLAKTMDVARDVLDVAKALCLSAAQQQTGLSLEDAHRKFCDTREKLEPWIGAAQEAQKSGALKSGMTAKQ